MKTVRTTTSAKPTNQKSAAAKTPARSPAAAEAGMDGKAASPAPAKRAAAKTESPSKSPGATRPAPGSSSSSRSSADEASRTASKPSGWTRTSAAKSSASRSAASGSAESAAAATSGWWGTASAAGSAKKTGSASTAPSKTEHSVPASGVDTLHAIYERRAVREYTGTKPSKDTIRMLLDAAVQAPSAMDLQPWAFVVVQDPALLQRLSERSKKLSLQRMKPGSGLSLHRRELEDPKFNVFHDAGTLVVVVAKPGEWPAVEDCCLAAQNLMLAAHAMGLGTCPIGFAREALDEPAAKQELGIPADHTVAMAIVVGYPKSRPPVVVRHEARMLAWR